MSDFPYYELSLAEPFAYRPRDGSDRTIVLEEVSDHSVGVRVDHERTTIRLAHFLATRDPVPPDEADILVNIKGLRIGADSTSELMKGTNYSRTMVNIRNNAHARLSIREADSPVSPPGKHAFPIPDFEWNLADSWARPVVYGFHLGLDLFARRGQPIVSITDGTVLDVRHFAPSEQQDDYWGNNLAVLGDDGMVYCYMHHDELSGGLEKGARVAAGQEIGPLGMSGFESLKILPHLHLEMMIMEFPEKFRFSYAPEPAVLPTPNRYLLDEVEGFAVNPYPYLVEWYLEQDDS